MKKTSIFTLIIGSEKLSVPIRYGTGVGLAFTALLLQLGLNTFVSSRFPFLIFVLVVTFAAAVIGRGPALIVLLTGFIYKIYMPAPAGIFHADLSPDKISLTYLMVGIFFILVGGMIRHVTQRAVIAEQKLSEERTQRAQVEAQRIRNMFEQAPGFMAVMRGPEHIFEFENAAHAELHGHREILGRNARDAFPEVTLQGFHDELDQVYRTGQSFRAYEMPLFLQRKQDGPPDQLYVDFVYQPIIDDHGDTTGIFVEGFDITEKKMAQAALRLTEARLKEGLSAGRMTVWDWDLRTDEVSFSENAVEIFGADLQTLRHPWKLLHPQDFDALKNAREQTISTGESFNVTARFVHPHTGEILWMEIRGRLRLDDKGDARALSGVTLDVSLYKQAEAHLKQGEHRRLEAEARANEAGEKFALAVDAAELGTFYCPMPLGKIYWNDTCKAHFFLPEDAEVHFDLFYSLIHPDDRERVRAAVDSAVSRREDYDVEYRTVAPDGRTRWIRAKGRSYFDLSGNTIRFDGITIDISRQKLAEEQWMLANRQKDDFLAMLAHELRNPLAPLAQRHRC